MTYKTDVTYLCIGLERELIKENRPIKFLNMSLYWSGGGTEWRKSTDKAAMTC